MIRIAGILMLLAGSGGFALSLVAERRAYLECCRQWRELFHMMEHEIAFQKSSLPEICSRVSIHISGSKKLLLERLGQALRQGEGDTLGEIWRREIRTVFREEPLKREIEQDMEEMGERLCFEDEGMQRRTLQDMQEKLKKHEEEQEKTNRERERLTLCGGVMGGLLLVILLI